MSLDLPETPMEYLAGLTLFMRDHVCAQCGKNGFDHMRRDHDFEPIPLAHVRAVEHYLARELPDVHPRGGIALDIALAVHEADKAMT